MLNDTLRTAFPVGRLSLQRPQPLKTRVTP